MDQKQEIIHDEEIAVSIFESLQNNLNWLEKIIEARCQSYFDQETTSSGHEIPDFPVQQIQADSPLEKLIALENFGKHERLIMVLALVPLLKPQILEVFFIKNSITDRAFSEFGGVAGKIHAGFMPTGETAIFLLSGGNLQKRITFIPIFRSDHPLFARQILQHPDLSHSEPDLAFPLVLTPSCKSLLLSGQDFRPDFSPTFPAKRLTTRQNWSDLVVENYILDDLGEIKTWLQHGDTIMQEWGFEKKLKPGFKALFHGPPGTGKTFAATLLGKDTGFDIYRIDLSMIVSKWIGETEKNLAGIFDQAEQKNWILFFDEADALFGKRTVTSSSNDRYANQEVSYLLQRIEDFPGVVILASNFKTNIDKAFIRRFQSIIQFSPPDKYQRLRLWENAFPPQTPLDPNIDLEQIANLYELTGGEIVNVVRHAALVSVGKSPRTITQDAILNGIRKEFHKEGKIFNF
ncbi:MAG: ATP-binding protein [Bacteroidia bacterium]|nr:ATP-binding protein [Bacteroidia bacterium]